MMTGKNDRMDELLDEDDIQSGSPAEDDWDSSYDDSDLVSEEEPVTLPPKKKKAGLPAKILVVAAIAVGGAVVFLQMGGLSQSPAVSPESPQMTAQQTWTASPPPVEVENPSVPPMPAPIEQAESAPSEQSSEIQGSPRMADSVGGAQSLRMPEASDVLLKSSGNNNPADNGVSASAVAKISDDLAGLSAKIDQVMGRLDKMEIDVSAVENLKGSVQDLEEKIAALSSARPVADQNPRPAEAKILSSAAPAVLAAPAPVPAAAPVILKKAPVQEDSGPSWVLKGAQPGRAMVSRPGENDIRTVEIGSVLAGIGQITDISYQDGRWVVTGTKGRITQ